MILLFLAVAVVLIRVVLYISSGTPRPRDILATLYGFAHMYTYTQSVQTYIYSWNRSLTVAKHVQVWGVSNRIHDHDVSYIGLKSQKD